MDERRDTLSKIFFNVHGNIFFANILYKILSSYFRFRLNLEPKFWPDPKSWTKPKLIPKPKFCQKLSNGYSPANLANSRTRAKLAVFGECEYSSKRPFSEICETRQTCRHSPSRVARTRLTRQHLPSRVARTRQTRKRRVWRVLCEFSESGESGEFGECRLDRFMHIKYVICA